MKKILGVFLVTLLSFSFAASNWFVNTEFKQDFRYRWQEETKADALTAAGGDKFTRYRERVRYRLGFESKANEEMFIGTRLATAGWLSNDALSTNDSMGENAGFTKDSIILDQAYLKYNPAWVPAEYGALAATFGKFDVKDGIYTVTDIMWDSDISLEGKNIKYTYNGNEVITPFVNIGSYTVLNNSTKDSEVLNVNQLGGFWKIDQINKLDLAVAKYTNARPNIGALSNSTLNDKPINNQMAKYTLDTQSLGMPIGYASLLWDEYTNTNSSERNRGTSSGLEIGTPKLAVLGDWSVKYLNRKLEKNAGWTYGDSDVYPAVGGTNTTGSNASGLNTKGTELELKVALAENATFSIDQYLVDVIDNDLGNDFGLNKVTQFDINVKF